MRGKPAAVVLSEADYARLMAQPQGETWVDRLIKAGLPEDFDPAEFERGRQDRGRDIDFD